MAPTASTESFVDQQAEMQQRVLDVAGFAHYLAETAPPKEDPSRLAAVLLECADDDDELVEVALRYDRAFYGTHDERAEMILDRAAHPRAA